MATRRDSALTRKKLVKAAQREFARHGFHGARTEVIAETARINKGLIYHYFKTKENLYTVVLEEIYATIRLREQTLDLACAAPLEGMRRMVEFTFDSWAKTPEFIYLLNDENLYRAKHIRKSKKIHQWHMPLVDMLQDLLDRGAKSGVFRPGVDPVQLYISIAAEVYFYFSNAYTLGVGFGRDLLTPEALATRRSIIVDVIIGYLTNKDVPKGDSDAALRTKAKTGAGPMNVARPARR